MQDHTLHINHYVSPAYHTTTLRRFLHFEHVSELDETRPGNHASAFPRFLLKARSLHFLFHRPSLHDDQSSLFFELRLLPGVSRGHRGKGRVLITNLEPRVLGWLAVGRKKLIACIVIGNFIYLTSSVGR
jgi:hypothetical protein